MDWTDEANRREPLGLELRFIIRWRWHFLQGLKRLAEERNYLFMEQMTLHDWNLIEGYANNAIMPALFA